MTLQQELMQIKKDKRLKYREIGQALNISESYAHYLLNSKRKIRDKFKPFIKNFIETIKNASVEEINTLFQKK